MKTRAIRSNCWLFRLAALSEEQLERMLRTDRSRNPQNEFGAMSDVLVLALPAALRLEHAKDDPSMVAVFWGPLLLAGELGRECMPSDFADKDAHLKLPPAAVPDIVSAAADPAKWLQPIEDATLAFRAHDAGPATGINFRPLFEVHHQRYAVYWKLDPHSAVARD